MLLSSRSLWLAYTYILFHLYIFYMFIFWYVAAVSCDMFEDVFKVIEQGFLAYNVISFLYVN